MKYEKKFPHLDKKYDPELDIRSPHFNIKKYLPEPRQSALEKAVKGVIKFGKYMIKLGKKILQPNYYDQELCPNVRKTKVIYRNQKKSRKYSFDASKILSSSNSPSFDPLYSTNLSRQRFKKQYNLGQKYLRRKCKTKNYSPPKIFKLVQKAKYSPFPCFSNPYRNENLKLDSQKILFLGKEREHNRPVNIENQTNESQNYFPYIPDYRPAQKQGQGEKQSSHSEDKISQINSQQEQMQRLINRNQFDEKHVQISESMMRKNRLKNKRSFWEKVRFLAYFCENHENIIIQYCRKFYPNIFDKSDSYRQIYQQNLESLKKKVETIKQKDIAYYQKYKLIPILIFHECKNIIKKIKLAKTKDMKMIENNMLREEKQIKNRIENQMKEDQQSLAGILFKDLNFSSSDDNSSSSNKNKFGKKIKKICKLKRKYTKVHSLKQECEKFERQLGKYGIKIENSLQNYCMIHSAQFPKKMTTFLIQFMAKIDKIKNFDKPNSVFFKYKSDSDELPVFNKLYPTLKSYINAKADQYESGNQQGLNKERPHLNICVIRAEIENMNKLIIQHGQSRIGKERLDVSDRKKQLQQRLKKQSQQGPFSKHLRSIYGNTISIQKIPSMAAFSRKK